MGPARLTTADHQRKLQLLDLFYDRKMVERVLVNVQRTPDAEVVLVNRNNPYALSAFQVGGESGPGPWFVDKGVLSLLLATGIFPCDVHNPVGAFEAPEELRKPIYVFFHF